MAWLRRRGSAPVGRRSAGLRLAILATALAVGVSGAVLLERAGSEQRAAGPVRQDVQGRPGATLAERAPVAELTRLLDRRATAVLRRDRSAFLATVDPASAFLRAQAALFDALAGVPLRSWSYQLGGGSPRKLPVEQARRYGDPTYVPDVVLLSYAFRGFDAGPTSLPMYLTFVHRPAGWLLGSDRDLDGTGVSTARELWDLGPVQALAGRRSLVLGHRSAGLRALAAAADRAVPSVSAVWGTGWSQLVVVVVPDSSTELSRLLSDDRDVSRLAAVATAWAWTENGRSTATGQRVLLNPANYAKLGALGRQVVLTHEITHVATRAATGPPTPVWLTEGFADYVAYRAAGVPVRAAAVELAADVRAGRLPAALPSGRDFDSTSGRLAQAYEGAWLACRLIAQQAGPAGLVRFYRAAGVPGDPEAVLAGAFRSVLGTTEAAFTARWRGYLRTSLS